MKLDLDQLFKLFEEVEKLTPLEESPNPTSSPSIDGVPNIGDGEGITFKLPRLHISENWGKETDPDKEDLVMALKTAGVDLGPGTPIEKLNQLKQGLNQSIQQLKTSAQVENPAKLLSQLVVFDTINRLFNSFQSSPLGFINEAFLSVLYGGQQIPTGEGNKESQIGDVKDADGIPVSVKTLSPGTQIGGSVRNLLESIKTSPGKKVYFDIFVKNPQKGKGEITELEAYRFEINEQNLSEILPGLKPLQESFLSEQKLKIPDLKDNLEEFINDLRSINWSPENADQILQKWNIAGITIPKNTPQEMFQINPEKYGQETKDKEGQLVPSIKGFGDPRRKYTDIFKDYAIAKGFLKKEEEDEYLDIINQLIQQEQSPTAGTAKDTQFKISPDFAMKQAGGKLVRIRFSRQMIDETLAMAEESLRGSVIQLFTQLEKFSTNLNKYFLSGESDRASQYAAPARDAANEIKTKAEEVVK